ncbi:MAG TPA: hypothetical protein VJW20_21475 [Candidatus Angelobacter sp.]|nr:hypothetical protein [Candidatus Angelobacter sp.]
MKKLRAMLRQKRQEPRLFKPGQAVPASGIYSVQHHPHRLMHMATLGVNMRFPRCKQCGDAVRFTLVRLLKDGRSVPFRSTAILEAYPDAQDFPQAS